MPRSSWKSIRTEKEPRPAPPRDPGALASQKNAQTAEPLVQIYNSEQDPQIKNSHRGQPEQSSATPPR